MTSKEIQAQIAEVTGSITAYNAKRDNLVAEKNVSLTSKAKCKTNNCRDARQGEANGWQDQINGVDATIADLKSRLTSLNASLKAANEAEVNLSKQGISQASAEILATGQADAVKRSAEITSAAQAQAITADAGASSNRKTMITVAIVGSILVVALIVGFILVKKMKSKKTNKSQPPVK